MAERGVMAATSLVLLGFVMGWLYGSGSSTLPVTARVTVAARLPPWPADELSGGHGSATASVAASAALEAATASEASATVEASAPFLLIGVISGPSSFGRRSMLRDFGHAAASAERPVRTEFVFGKRFFSRPPSSEVQQRLADEAALHGDVVFVDGRERLPHVGKAAEKSAAWWLTAPKRSGAQFFCKTDDDSLIHHAHLAAALAESAKASARCARVCRERARAPAGAVLALHPHPPSYPHPPSTLTTAEPSPPPRWDDVASAARTYSSPTSAGGGGFPSTASRRAAAVGAARLTRFGTWKTQRNTATSPRGLSRRAPASSRACHERLRLSSPRRTTSRTF